MEHKRILAALLNEPWLITPEGLNQMISIVQHGGDFEALRVKRAEQLAGTRVTTFRDGIATIPVLGPIFPRATMFSDISGAVSLESLAKDFKAAEDDESIEEIIMYYDTPGGAVTGVSEFANMVHNCSKPVTSYVAGTGASAGYWLASAGKTVVLDSTARVGSIGVVVAYPKNDDSSSVEIVSSNAPNKRPDPGTKEGVEVIREQMDALETVFIEQVASFRGVSPDTVKKKFGKGGCLVGQTAVDVGMADKLGSYEGLFNSNHEGGISMNMSELKEKHPALYQQCVDAGKVEATESMKVQLTEKDSQIATQNQEITKLQEKVKADDTRLLALEKGAALQSEQAIKATAGSIVSTALANSSIPERLHTKVQKQCNHESFVKDGVLDVVGFTASVDAEVKDWSVDFPPGTKVLGMGVQTKVETTDDDTKAADEIADRMLGHVNQKK